MYLLYILYMNHKQTDNAKYNTLLLNCCNINGTFIYAELI